MQTELIYAYEAFQISTATQNKTQWDGLFKETLQALNREIINAASRKERKCLFKIPEGVAYDRLHNKLTHRGYVFERFVNHENEEYLTVKW